jgi:dipeptidyl-peptidase 4
MRKFFLLFLLAIAFSANIFAQDKLFTVEDVTINAYPKFLVQNLRQLNWLPSSDNFVYVDGQGDAAAILKYGTKSTSADTFLTLAELNGFLEKSQIEKLKNFPPINWNSETAFSFWAKNDWLSFDIKFRKLTKNVSVNDDAENKAVSPNSKFVAYTKSNNLFVALNDGKQIQITNDADTNIVNGQAVHRNEFGIEEGIFWSPKSEYIAFYRMDQTMVTDYPFVDISYTPARLKNIKYPMAGQASHHVTIGIYNIKSGETTWLKTGEPLDQYYTCLTWSPDAKYFFVAHLNRDQNYLQLKKYDVKTGEVVKILFEEKNEKYVEPQNPLTFLPNSNDNFLWFSQRDGFNHLYLYDTEGNFIRQVTQGKWLVNSLDGFDKTGKNIFVSTTKDSPLEKHVYKVNLDNGKMQKLTKEPGTHTVLANSNNDFYIDFYSSTSVPRIINLVDEKGKIVKNLLTAANPFNDLRIGKTKIFTLKNDDRIDLYSRIITPPDFDSTKKYPVIVYVYGGPHDQEITNSFGYGRYFMWFYLMAQKGYIIFTLDNRGSSNRGLEFEQATFRHLGTVEIKDQMTGVNYLKSLPYIDENRIGVYGWSYGGFMTTSLMLRTDNAFKVGACGGAVIDWNYYEVMYTERYMDTPQTNPDGYKEACLLNYVQNLNGKLLLVHGTFDPTVVWQNTLAFAKKAADLNKPLDYFPYIGHSHGVSGVDVLHLYTKITNYFLDNL